MNKLFLNVLAQSSILLISFSSCGSGKDQSNLDASHETIIAQEKLVFKDDPNDDFHHKYTPGNTILGKWQLYLVDSKRNDDSMGLFKNWVEKTSNVYLNIVDKKDEYDVPYADMTFELYSTTEISATSGCKVSFGYTGTYCCMNMLRITLEEKPNSLSEKPANCSQTHFGKSAQEVANRVRDALIESQTSATPIIYHFIYSKSNNRIRLVNPAPKNKTVPLSDLETAIHMIRTGS